MFNGSLIDIWPKIHRALIGTFADSENRVRAEVSARKLVEGAKIKNNQVDRMKIIHSLLFTFDSCAAFLKANYEIIRHIKITNNLRFFDIILSYLDKH